MGVGSVPPRIGPPVTVVTETVAEPKRDDKPVRPQDGLDRAAAAPKPVARATALPPSEPGTGSVFDAFAQMAGQIGELPDGVRMATALEATLPQLEERPQLGSALYSAKRAAATCELVQLLRSGNVELPADAKTRLMEQFAVLTSAAPSVQLQLSKLSREQRDALASLQARCANAFGQLGPAARRKRVHALGDEEKRELVERALADDDSDGDAPPAPEDVFSLKQEAEGLNIILPDASIVAMEQAWVQALPTLSGCDPALVVDLVMAQCAASEDDTLQALLSELEAQTGDCEEMSAQLAFYLERRAAFAAMLSLMVKA